MKVPERFGDEFVILRVGKGRFHDRSHELGRRPIAMLLDVMHDHLGGDEKQIAGWHAKITYALCVVAKLACVESRERSEIVKALGIEPEELREARRRLAAA